MLHLGRRVKLLQCSQRCLNLQEYSSKNLLNTAGVNIQPFHTAGTADEARVAAEALLAKPDCSEIVLKAQILAGGRGKGTFLPSGYQGGVKLSSDANEIGELASKMLGQNLVTKQTLPEGVRVDKVMVAHALDIEKETYLAILMDRESMGPVIVASPDGGMDIEKVAEETPERIFKLPVNIFSGLEGKDKELMELVGNLGFPAELHNEAAGQIKKLYEFFLKVDATQVEINPFGLTKDNKIVCFDAKINFDDCAQYRQKDIFALNDTKESDPREVAAEAAGLNFISLDGNIACIVNGAGLAMATMDIIKLHGGSPANFLDLGGGVTAEGVLRAFEIIMEDKGVEAIFINIFGGIVDCNVVAAGLIDTMKAHDIPVPVVVRVEGNNVNSAKQMLKDSGLNIIAADGFDDGARRVCAAATEGKI